MGTLFVLFSGTWFVLTTFFAAFGHRRMWIASMIVGFLAIIGVLRLVDAKARAGTIDPMGGDIFAGLLIAPFVLALAVGAIVGLIGLFRNRRQTLEEPK